MGLLKTREGSSRGPSLPAGSILRLLLVMLRNFFRAEKKKALEGPLDPSDGPSRGLSARFHFVLSVIPMPAKLAKNLFAINGNMLFFINIWPDSLAYKLQGFEASLPWDLRAWPLEVL